MNILEALEEIDCGKIIRLKINGDVFYGLQTILSPFECKNIVKIALQDFKFLEEEPSLKNWHTVDYEEEPEICLNAIRSTDYKIITLDELLAEAKGFWKRHQED